MKQLVLFFIIIASFFSYSMDNQLILEWKKPDVIILNANQKTFIHHYIMNTLINAQEKRFLLHGLKPKKKRRV